MGEKQSIRDVQYGVYCGGTKPGMRTVRKGDWKLIKYDMMDGEVRETQLFNLRENPHEYLPEHHKSGEMETNLAGNPKYAEKLAEMEALLLEQMKKHKDLIPGVKLPAQSGGTLSTLAGKERYGQLCRFCDGNR